MTAIHEAATMTCFGLFLLVDGLLLHVLSGKCDNCRERFVGQHGRRARISSSVTV
jgi:hypothetical protein